MSKSLIYRLPLLLAIGLFASMPAYAGGGGWFIKPLGLMLGGAMQRFLLRAGRDTWRPWLFPLLGQRQSQR